MKQVSITGFTLTFDLGYFNARHDAFTRKVIHGEISLDDAVANACSSSYDPTTIYNTLQPLLAVRDADRKKLALKVGASVVGALVGLSVPYFFNDDPSVLAVLVSGLGGGTMAGFLNFAGTDAPYDDTPEQQYDLSYKHIGAVVAALGKKYELHKPMAEQLVPGEGECHYKAVQSRTVQQVGIWRKVESTIRHSLQTSEYIIDLLVVNDVPESIRILKSQNKKRNNTMHWSQIEEYTAKTHVHFARTPIRFADALEEFPLSFPQKAVERYQAAIAEYGRLTVK